MQINAGKRNCESEEADLKENQNIVLIIKLFRLENMIEIFILSIYIYI